MVVQSILNILSTGMSNIWLFSAYAIITSLYPVKSFDNVFHTTALGYACCGDEGNDGTEYRLGGQSTQQA